MNTFQQRLKSGEITLKGKRKHTKETKDKISKSACERKEKHSKYTKNVEYLPGIILESSYEVKTAEILDKLSVSWVKVRKGFIWKNNSNEIRRYIPDFYLPKYDIYLDPKNDFLIKKDKFKINSAMEINDIVVIILSFDRINEEYISKLLQLYS